MTTTTPKILRYFFIISWITYFTSYIGRLNYSACMIQIGQSEGYSTSQLGTIVTALFISYGIGQLISGILGDHFSSRRLVTLGMIGCGICNLFVYFSTSYELITLSWFCNGFALSLIWSPMLKLFTQYMPKDYLSQCCFNIQTSVALGTFFTYLVCSFMIIWFDWQVIFLVSALLLVVVAIVWEIFVTRMEGSLAPNSTSEESHNNSPALDPSTLSAKKLFIGSGLCIILIAIIIMGFLKDGIMTWIPQYIIDTFELDTYFSIFLSAFLPLINLSGIYLGKYLYIKTKFDDLKTTAIFYVISILSLSALVLLGSYHVLISVLLFAIVTSCMLGINTILISILPTYFSKYNKVSTIAGLTNSMTYLGSAICGYGLGTLAEKVGWSITVVVLVFICIIGVLACLLAKPLWCRFKSST